MSGCELAVTPQDIHIGIILQSPSKTVFEAVIKKANYIINLFTYISPYKYILFI